jgi:hypothetical protein
LGFWGFGIVVTYDPEGDSESGSQNRQQEPA